MRRLVHKSTFLSDQRNLEVKTNLKNFLEYLSRYIRCLRKLILGLSKIKLLDMFKIIVIRKLF